jgi:hypothetical protein
MSEDAKETLAKILVNKELHGHGNVREAYQLALGSLTINFSLLHFLLERVAWDLWKVKGASATIITKDLRMSHLVEKLKATANDAIPQDERPQFLDLLKRAGKAAEDRNELLHSLWIIEDGQPVLCISRKRGALSGSQVPSVEDIEAVSASLVELSNEISFLWGWLTAKIK